MVKEDSLDTALALARVDSLPMVVVGARSNGEGGQVNNSHRTINILTKWAEASNNPQC